MAYKASPDTKKLVPDEIFLIESEHPAWSAEFALIIKQPVLHNFHLVVLRCIVLTFQRTIVEVVGISNVSYSPGVICLRVHRGSLEHLSKPFSDEDRKHLPARHARDIYPLCGLGHGQRLKEISIMSAYYFVQLVSRGIFARFSSQGHAARILNLCQFCHNQFELNFSFDRGSNLFAILLGAIRNCEDFGSLGSLNLAKFLTLNVGNSCAAPLEFHIRETNSVRKYALLDVSTDVLLVVPLNVLPVLGECFGRDATFALDTREDDPPPKGEVHIKKDIVLGVTLHDLDAASAETPEEQDILSLVSPLMTPRETEIADKLWQKRDNVVPRYFDESAIELVPAVLFNKKVHMLDMGYFPYLNLVMESSLFHTSIFATNKGTYYVTRTTMTTHCILVDLLDWVLNVKTETHYLAAVMSLLVIRVRMREPCRKQKMDWIVIEMHKESLIRSRVSTFSSVSLVSSNLEDKVLIEGGSIVVNLANSDDTCELVNWIKAGQAIGPGSTLQRGQRISWPNKRFVWDPG